MSTPTSNDNAEAAALLRSLQASRRHVLGILEGLDEEQLRQPVLPSGWSCAGLVSHLALDVEHYWFRCIIGGESLDLFQEGEDRWQLREGETGAGILDLYRKEIEAADAVIAEAALDMPPRQVDEWWGEWKVPDVRFVMLHVIT